MRRLTIALLATLITASVAPGYYHFLRFAIRNNQLTPVPLRFDLSALPNKTVQYFLTDQSPVQMAPGDSMASLASQIRLAAKAWNDVETSELRLAWGGIRDSGAPLQNSPGIDIVFDEVPPGLLAVGGPVTFVEPAAGASFAPILRSRIILRKDLSTQPSYSEQTYLTLVHEIGHALGLQHTMTGSVMTTSITRAIAKARPIGPDDAAGLSALYPTRSFQTSLGSVAGRVSLGGAGQNLASVTAISPASGAVSAFTAPDGTYRIDGIPPGQYYLYVQPLPPQEAGEVTPLNLELPIDPQGRRVPPAQAFDTVFFPGVKDPLQAAALTVSAGAVMEGVNFNVQRRASLSLYNAQAYSYPGQSAIRPAYVNTNGNRNYLAVTGVGLLNGGQPAPGLRAGILGSAVSVSGIRPFTPAFLVFDLGFTPFSGEGVRHMFLSRGDELHIQPNSLYLATRQPPAVNSVTVAADRTAQVTGTGFNAETRVWVDGVAAPVRAFDEVAGRLSVALPAAPSSHRAVVVAYNADGQSSLYLQPDNPPSVVYDAADAPFAVLSPASVPTGVETLVEVVAVNANFVERQAGLGFGTGDVLVRNVWVQSPTRLIANIVVASGSPAASLTATVTSGLHSFTIPTALTTIPSATRVSLGATPLGSLQGGASGQLPIYNYAGGALSLTVADRPATGVSVSNGVLSFQLPAGIPAGPAVLRLTAGADVVPPVAVFIDTVAPQLVAAVGPGNAILDGGRPAHAGEPITLTLFGVSDPGARITISVAGIDHLLHQTQSQGGGLLQVSFILLSSVPAGGAQIVVSVDGRPLNPLAIVVR